MIPYLSTKRGKGFLLNIPLVNPESPGKEKLSLPLLLKGTNLCIKLFKSPDDRFIKKWVSVEHITSETQSEENKKKIEALSKINKKTAETFTQEKILHIENCCSVTR